MAFFYVEAHKWVGVAADLFRNEEAAGREGNFYRKKALLSLVFDTPNSEHLESIVKEHEHGSRYVYDDT